MKYNSFGTMKVRTYVASEALPVEDVLVKVYGTDDNNKDVMYSIITDSDGVTKEITLPTPDKSYSTSPGAIETPYAVYTVEVAKDGFYPKVINNIPIFGQTAAVLPIEMIPLSFLENGNIIQQNNLNSTIYENENLE